MGVVKKNYKGIDYFYTDYSECRNDKAKVIQLINTVAAEYMKQPENSVRGLTNVSDLHFDMDILNVFKEATAKTKPYDKKIALVGVNGLLKVAYNFVIGLTKDGKNYRAFDKESEALEWVVSE